jgi:hypothetical protein
MRRERALYLDRGKSGIRKSFEENIMLAASVWNKCFKRSFLEYINLSPISRTVFDDVPFAVCSVLAAEYFYWLNFVGYSWLQRSGSLSRSTLVYSRSICTIAFLEKELRRLKIYDEMEFKIMIACMLGWDLSNYNDSLEYKNFYNECRKIFRSFDLTKNIKLQSHTVINSIDASVYIHVGLLK